MPSKKEVKRRIASVTTTKQIMKAMDMVAASKLQRAKARLDVARPLYAETKRMTANLHNHLDAMYSPYLAPRKVKNSAYIVIVGDKGLCGSYNISVMQAALAHMNEGEGKNEKLVVIGSKGLDYFRRYKKNIEHKYGGLSETLYYEYAGDIGEIILSWYNAGEIDEAYVVYTHFETTLSYVPRVVQALPLISETPVTLRTSKVSYEPDMDTYLEHAIPTYLTILIYEAMCESITCEYASRMTSMNSASNNATEIIDDLTRMYNRKRQAAITQEISEIVNGANMMK